MTKVFRAAWNEKLGPASGHFCCAEDRSIAEAYLGDGGYGGPDLYSFDLDIEITDINIDFLVNFAKINGFDDEYIESISKCEWVYQALDNLCAWEWLMEAGILAVRYEDEYPAGSIAIAYFGDVVIGKMEGCGNEKEGM